MSSWVFLWNLAYIAAKAAWANMGTNGLGWITAVSGPSLAAFLRASRAPKGSKWAAVRSQWIGELRDGAFVSISIWLIICLAEALWLQPKRIWTDAASISAPPSVKAYMPSPQIAEPRSHSGTHSTPQSLRTPLVATQQAQTEDADHTLLLQARELLAGMTNLRSAWGEADNAARREIEDHFRRSPDTTAGFAKWKQGQTDAQYVEQFRETYAEKGSEVRARLIARVPPTLINSYASYKNASSLGDLSMICDELNDMVQAYANELGSAKPRP
jgi:hypothetical protein